MPNGKAYPSHRFLATFPGKQPGFDLSIVVPVYNSAPTLGQLLARLAPVISPLTKAAKLSCWPMVAATDIGKSSKTCEKLMVAVWSMRSSCAAMAGTTH